MCEGTQSKSSDGVGRKLLAKVRVGNRKPGLTNHKVICQAWRSWSSDLLACCQYSFPLRRGTPFVFAPTQHLRELLGKVENTSKPCAYWWAVQDLNLWPPVCKFIADVDCIEFTGLTSAGCVIIGSFWAQFRNPGATKMATKKAPEGAFWGINFCR